jgi:hypothetical protein
MPQREVEDEHIRRAAARVVMCDYEQGSWDKEL